MNAGSYGGGGSVGDSGLGGVESIGHKIGAAVNHEDEAEGPGDEKVVRLEEELREGGTDGFHYWALAGGILHDAP